MADALRRCDAWIIPSVEEGFGLQGIEALACGAIPITSGVGGMQSYTRDGQNSIVVNKAKLRDKDGWLDAIESFVNMPDEQREQMREAGRKMSLRFTIQKAAKRLSKFVCFGNCI